MADELRPDPATDLDEGAVDSVATQGGGNNSAADDIRNALGSEGDSKLDNSPHEQMRRQIGEALAKETSPENQAEAPVEIPAKSERARGADGRFIPTPQETAAGIDPNDQAVVQSAVDPNAPPGSWKKELQARWGELPAEFQAEILKREADVAKGFEKYQNLRAVEPVLDFAENLGKQFGIPGQRLVHQWAQIQEGLLDPAKRAQILSQAATNYGVEHAGADVMGYAAQIAPQLGTTASQVVAQWAIFDNAMRNPATRKQAYDFLAKAYPMDGAQAQTQADPNQWVDPDVAELKQRLAQVQGWQQQMEQQAQQQHQQQMYQVQQAKMSAIDQFSSEKGPDGQPLRPHLETVAADMATALPRIKAANPSISDQDALQQAYESAVWSNPTTRAQVLNATMIAEKAKDTEKAQERARAAARGAVSPATASPQGPPATMPAKGDLRDQMRATLEQFAP